MKKKITIGSRGSKLALLYAQKVKQKIIEVTNFTDQDINIEKISTSNPMKINKKIYAPHREKPFEVELWKSNPVSYTHLTLPTTIAV